MSPVTLMEFSLTLNLTSLACNPGVMLTHVVERIKGAGIRCPTCPWHFASPRLLRAWNSGLSLPALVPVPSTTSLPGRKREEHSTQARSDLEEPISSSKPKRLCCGWRPGGLDSFCCTASVMSTALHCTSPLPLLCLLMRVKSDV